LDYQNPFPEAPHPELDSSMIKAASLAEAAAFNYPRKFSLTEFPVVALVGSITIAAQGFPAYLDSLRAEVTLSRAAASSEALVGYEITGHPRGRVWERARDPWSAPVKPITFILWPPPLTFIAEKIACSTADLPEVRVTEERAALGATAPRED
jgi:hypothetical protein